MIKQEGSGWRLAWDNTRLNFPILIGGEDWTFELTFQEWECLSQLVLDLVEEHKQIKTQLMEEESISLEIEREFCWGCLEGDKDVWSLHILLESKDQRFRGVEATWPKTIAKDLCKGLELFGKQIND